jgi:hypothetical protein
VGNIRAPISPIGVSTCFFSIYSIYKAMMIIILGLNSSANSSEYEQKTAALVAK